MSDDTATNDAQGAPPPAEPRLEPPPAQEQPWAARFGLVRPRHGRYLAGVCAAIGRATATDPLLWRVLIGVLAIFGVGIVIYVAGWLLMPAEGDTASPVEALFGRGRSSTSSGLTLVLGVLAVVLLGALTDSWVVAIIAAVALAVAALAINPRSVRQMPLPAMPPSPPPPPQQPHLYAPVPGAVPPPGSYQPPFAPHGPYAPPPPPPVPPMAPKPKPEPSRLGRLIFGLILIALGAVGLADMAGVSVPGAAYVATALGVVGIGLVIGAWYGRARGFILLGLVLAVILPMAAVGDRVERTHAGSVVWNPDSIDQMSSRYEHQFGEARLDLSDVDFTNRKMEIVADITFGNMRIILPPNVDATVVSNVSFGDAQVFDHNNNGVGVDNQQTDVGEDGVGGGELLITLNVQFGHAEVNR